MRGCDDGSGCTSVATSMMTEDVARGNVSVEHGVGI